MPRILLAEDDATSAMIATRTLQRAGHEVRHANNGLEALELLQQEAFDAVVTDWMMPVMDGLDLVRRIHARFDPVPATIMVTCLTMPEARAHALESGADEFVAKPVHSHQLLAAVDRAIARRNPAIVASVPVMPALPGTGRAPFPIVVVGANAGGPAALRLLLRACGPAASEAAWVVAQNGLPEMILGLMPLLQRETGMRVALATHGQPLMPGRVLLGPGGSHVGIAEDGLSVEIVHASEQHHVRPAADVLFRTAAQAAGSRCVAVILTGMGIDGTMGAAFVRSAQGRVLVAQPGPHVASGMAKSVQRAGLATSVHPLESLGGAVTQAVGEVAHVRMLMPAAS